MLTVFPLAMVRVGVFPDVNMCVLCNDSCLKIES